MKMSMFRTPQQFAEWANSHADYLERGLKREKETYEQELQGVGRESFLEWNHISDDKADEMWEHHHEWRRGSIASMERRIKKLRKDANKAMMMA